MIKKILAILMCIMAAVLLVVFFPFSKQSKAISFSATQGSVVGKFNQKIEGIEKDAQRQYRVYEKGEFLGVLQSEEKLEKHLKEIYRSRYQKDYPNSQVHLSEDIYLTESQTPFLYSDKDEEIFRYLSENHLYELEATAISFANEKEVYQRIFVANEEIYQQAMDEFVSYFNDLSSVSMLNRGEEASSLTTYGTRDTGVTIAQKLTIAKMFAKPEEIMKTKEEVLDFLKYGTNKEREYYVVQKYDTLAGVGYRNHGLSAQQVMNINRDKISNVNQTLEEGMELCVTYFTSPIEITVTKEVMREAPIYYRSTTVEDETLLEGTSEVRQKGEDGLRSVLYEETWVNGVLFNGVEKSSTVLEEPRPELIAVGTMSQPDVGTGNYRYPVDNARITCPWGCYFGHRGVDFVNIYDAWADVYAADNGVIVENSYTGINGNYVIIDHNNGVRSYYGHMRVPSELPVGTVVQRGQVIGHIGMTGLATGPHVHFHFDDGVFDHYMDACEFVDCEGLVLY
ncbi:MAG: M23 family metallopeptidase [Solobacterium sp.]|nr:M23 family metallopeptidase [Solobacterium sp.]